MTSLGSPSPFFLAGKKAYQVERSLRFNSGDSPYLSRTPSSAGNRRTYTISVWAKIIDNNTYRAIIGAGGGSNRDRLQIFDDDKIVFNLNDGGDAYLRTNRVARDPSAWYHLVVGVDTTQGTASNRIKLYVNGVQETSFTNETYPSQNYDCRLNNNIETYIGNSSANSLYFEGYLAEFNFIDGQALTPSSFGETDATTGQWNPKKYVGSYGTNGFYLNFSDNSGTTATTLGKDSSGNGNNFTPNNFSVAAGVGNDSVTDTPSNNFMTWNPLYPPSSSVTHSNGNLDWSSTAGAAFRDGRGNFVFTSGKWYVEATVSAFTQVGTGYSGIGLVVSNKTHNAFYIGSTNLGGTGYFVSGTVYINGSYTTGHGSYTLNDVIGLAIDFDNLKIYYHKNGTYINSGNPTAGSGGFTFVNDTGGFCVGCSSYGTVQWSLNSGQIKADSTSYADENGYGAFKYTVPSGYKAMCSANLPDPTILLPNKHFDTKLWTGNGGTQTISGLSFAPDWVWIKSRSSAINHQLIDTVRGATLRLQTNGTTEEKTNTNGLSAFTSDGYTLGDQDNVNGSGLSLVGWNWNAGDTDSKTYKVKVVSDSTDYGHGTGSNKYQFFKSDGTTGFGTNGVDLDLEEGGTYIFDWSDSSAQSHPIRFSLTNDGTHSSGTSAGSEYTTGVTKDDSAYKTTITVASGVANLFYYCQNHSGMGAEINTNTTKGSTNFDGDIQAVVKANTTAGFSIAKWTTTANAYKTVGHGLGVKPQIVIMKRRDSTNNWATFYDVVDGTNDYVYLNLTNAAENAQDYSIVPPTSTVFGTDGAFVGGAVGATMIAYVFSEVSSYSKFGSYKGNGSSDGTFVFTGFRPAWIMTKNASSSGTWLMLDSKRGTFNPNGISSSLYADESTAENTFGNATGVDFLSNGFKLRDSIGYVNGSGNTIIYLAFAESPFKNARAR